MTDLGLIALTNVLNRSDKRVTIANEHQMPTEAYRIYSTETQRRIRLPTKNLNY